MGAMTHGVFGDLHAHIGATRLTNAERVRSAQDEAYRLLVRELAEHSDLAAALRVALDNYDELREAAGVKP